MNLPYAICMYRTNFWQPNIHVQQNIFEETLIEVGSSRTHLYASFGTFCLEIGQLFEAQWVDCPLMEGNQSAHPKYESPNGNKT